MILRYFVMFSGVFLLVVLLTPTEEEIIKDKSAVYFSNQFPKGEFGCLPISAKGEECLVKRIVN